VLAIRRLLAVLGLAVAVALLAAAPSQAPRATTKCTAVAVLKPRKEVPPVESRTSGAAAVHGTRLSFAVAIANPERETFTAGDIHIGGPVVNDDVRVPLFTGSNDRRLLTQFDCSTSGMTPPRSAVTLPVTTSTNTQPNNPRGAPRPAGQGF
jgi:hypothetical protein